VLGRLVGQLLDDLGEGVVGILVVVADSQRGCEGGVIRVLGGETRCELCSQLIQLSCLDPIVNLGKYALGESVGVDGQASGCLLNPPQDLVEGHRLLRTVALNYVHTTLHDYVLDLEAQANGQFFTSALLA